MTEETLFELARKTPEAERKALLDRACEGKPELRARVEALLQADAGSSPFSKPSPTIDATTGFQATASYSSAEPVPGIVIAGRYTLEQKLGEGGMGEVWVAKQSEPVKRKVALKLIKAGMDSKSVVQRFEQERQALALMDHPNIAKVLDGGITEHRQPFFVMELVNGLPLTKFCDEAKLSIKERLELFVPICQAVQHAHQKGIVHRDLKPSNILVTMIDGKPIPKVIDFGVAKATGGKLTDESLSTQFGAVIGTLEYMSPEQAGFSNQDVDTRADIYSLGVILYELLTGLRPFDSKRLKQAALDEVIRIIREEEPSKPSTKLSTDESLPSLAAVRHIEPGKLTALLRGELDWVVMKCLEKQRDRRYETANGLARDIQRYLADEPVEAKPPSAGYRLRKLYTRNKGKVIAAGLVLLALVLGMLGTAWQAYRAEQARVDEAKQRAIAEANENKAIAAREEEARQRSIAEKNNKLAEDRLVQVEAEKRRADEEKQIAQAVNHFLQKKLLAQADTTAQANQLLQAGELATKAKFNPTIKELLDRAAGELAADKIEANFPNQPLVQAQILRTVGEAYRGIGEVATGIPFLIRSADLLRASLGHDHFDTLHSLNNLATSYYFAGQLEKALPLYEETFKLMKAKLGHDHPDTLVSMGNLASGYSAAGMLNRAMPLIEETLELRKAKLGPDHPDTLSSLGNLALGYEAAGKLDRALPLFEETFKLKKAKLGPDHPDTLSSMNNLAKGYQAAGKLDRALPLFEETLTLRKTKLGPDHPHTLSSMASLALGYKTVGKLDRALPLFEETYILQKTKLGFDHPDTLTSMGNLAGGYIAAGKFDLALPLCEETFKLTKAKLGHDHPSTLISMGNLAEGYQAAGKLDLALPLYEESLQLMKAKFGPDHPKTLISMSNLAKGYRAARKLDQALPLYEETLKLMKAKLGLDHPSTLTSMNNLAMGYKAAGKLNLALPLLEETLQLRKAKLGSDHPDTLTSMNNLAGGYKDAGKLDLAQKLHEETQKLLKAKLGPSHPYTLTSMKNLSTVYRLTKQGDKADSVLKEFVAVKRKAAPKDPPSLAGWLTLTSLELLPLGEFPIAEELLRECLAIREKTQPDGWETFNTQSMLGGVLLGQKKYAEVEPLLLKGYEGMKAREKTIPLKATTRLPEALDRLIQFYTETNKPDEVKKWQAEKEKLPKLPEKK